MNNIVLKDINSLQEIRRKNMVAEMQLIVDNWNNLSLNDGISDYPFLLPFDELFEDIKTLNNYKEIREIHYRITNWIDFLSEDDIASDISNLI